TNAVRSFLNLPEVQLIEARELNAYDVLCNDWVVFSQATLPGGTAHPIGALYAHMVVSEDFVVNGMVRGAAPLMMSAFAGKTGLSEPPPMPGGDLHGWAVKVQIDLDALKAYDKAVRAATDEFLAGASDADLDKKVAFGQMGDQPVSYILGLIALVHPSNHIGEISALKGVYGGKGYPF
ncbi:MAG: DinB family protein, partial [Chloroflexota bacterium]